MGIKLKDAAGVAHGEAGNDARILSLVPSLTELLFDLGLGDSVVGRTAFCIHPAGGVRRVKSVGGTKTVNMEKVLALDPTHAVVNIDETPKALADELAGLGINVVVTHPLQVSDNAGLYRLLGGIFGAREEADRLAETFEAAHRRVRSRITGAPEKKVLYLIWKDPWMTVTADTYISRMLSLIGWQTVIPGNGPENRSDAGPRYPEIELSDTVLADIDLVLFSTEPFPFKELHLAEFKAAFPAHGEKARLVDGQLISWYGSRAIQGLAYLEELSAGESP
ncbi:MAG: helical backbone metal receptor [Rhodospirillales bacterium]